MNKLKIAAVIVGLLFLNGSVRAQTEKGSALDSLKEWAGTQWAASIKEAPSPEPVAVSAGGESPALLNNGSAYTTYLSVKGADLIAYRLGKLSKEEARKAVDISRR